MRALAHAMALAATALVLIIVASPASAADAEMVAPAPLTPAIAMKRQAWFLSRNPALTNELLAAYVERRKALEAFDAFDVRPEGAQLTEAVLMGYIARRRNDALEAIETVDITSRPALTADVLSAYASKGFVPTVKKVKLAEGEKLCLAQAIYHEARGESRDGQLAVANVIINRAFSKKYPSTICGVVFQNADRGRYKCQFTFACDGRSDMGNERTAWNRSAQLAEEAFYAYQRGERLGVVPKGTMYYHTTAVAPRWSHTFKRVAAIGSHIFYVAN